MTHLKMIFYTLLLSAFGSDTTAQTSVEINTATSSVAGVITQHELRFCPHLPSVSAQLKCSHQYRELEESLTMLHALRVSQNEATMSDAERHFIQTLIDDGFVHITNRLTLLEHTYRK